MPVQKDLKRIVRARMQKTGESYTTARLQLVRKKSEPEPLPDYAALAGMSDGAIEKQTGKNWAGWVAVLDAFGAAKKEHREIAEHVHSLGVGDWWSQSVTVGYERIRGLRQKGQRRSGKWEMSKSRTLAVPIDKLFAAFADAKTRRKWLPEKIKIRTAQPNKSIRIGWEDGTIVAVGFFAKGGKSQVALSHVNLASKAEADRLRTFWTERLAALSDILK